MKASEAARLFEETAPVEIGIEGDREAGVLGFRFGDSDVEVTGLGVAWFLSMEVIEEAVNRQFNMLLIHEPQLFSRNRSCWHTCLEEDMNPVNLKKKKLLIDNGICVYTAHSNWDMQATVGMQPTFARALGFTDELKRDTAVGIYRVNRMPFSELAKGVKKVVGLEQLRIQGNPEKIIETVAVGFGNMGFVVDAILANHADAGVFGELGEFAFMAAREADVGLIETTHLVSESIGFRSVVEVMTRKLPGIPVAFLEVPFTYRWF